MRWFGERQMQPRIVGELDDSVFDESLRRIRHRYFYRAIGDCR